MAKRPKRYLLSVTLTGTDTWAPPAGTRARIVGGYYNHVCNQTGVVGIGHGSSKTATPLSQVIIALASQTGYLNDLSSDITKYLYNNKTDQMWIHRGYVIYVNLGTDASARLLIEVVDRDEPFP